MPDVIPFERYNLTSVADSLDVYVRQLRAGTNTAVRVALVIEDENGNLDYRCFGEEPFSKGLAVGMLTMAACKISENA